MSLFWLVLLPFLVSPLVKWVGQSRMSGWVALVPMVVFVGLAGHLPAVMQGEVIAARMQWIPSLGVGLALRLDGLSLLFALLISGIGTLIFLYASKYLSGHRDAGRFFVSLTLFTGAMLGAVLADDVIALLVFWELTSLTSFLLIGFDPSRVQNRRSAQQGLLITVAGGLCLLAGLILLGQAAGTYRLSDILAQGSALALHASAPAIVVLVALGAFAKSAQVPLHMWLANAMVAPTPVSAFLHSATMVKLGVYLLARLHPVFGEQALWTPLLSVAGLATMITACILTLRETDLKRVLAYSTVVSLGTLVVLIAQPGALAAYAMVTFLLVHALYKACLFMVAGCVDHATGTRDATRLGGLRRSMPLTACAAVLAGLSMAGLPPFLGFLGKELIYEAGLGGTFAGVSVTIALLANASMVVVAGILTLKTFFGEASSGAHVEHAEHDAHSAHDPSWRMLAGPIVLAVFGLYFGLFPASVQGLLAPAAAAVSGQSIALELSLWHGLTPMLVLSIATYALGAILLWRWAPVRRYLAGCEAIDRYGPDRGYDRLLDAIMRFADWQTRVIQQGSLRFYVSATLTVMAIATLATLLLRGAVAVPAAEAFVWAPEMVLPVLLMAATIAVLRAQSFMRGIIAAGMVGFGVGLSFLFLGAPDLAFTQFSVEALAIVILLAIVGRMPFHSRDARTTGQRRRDALVAIVFGITASLVLLAVLASPFNTVLSDFFRASSLAQAHGRNLVNVIIVDFRALDTLGEITVLALAALAAAAVIASSPKTNTKRRAK